MLNTVLFAAGFSYKTSLIALVATDCPSVLIESLQFFMPSNPSSIREYHLSLQFKDPPVVFPQRLFVLSRFITTGSRFDTRRLLLLGGGYT